MLKFMANPAYLIFGNDDYRVSEKAREIVEKHVSEDAKAFGLEVVDGRVDTVDTACDAIGECLQALNTSGFLMGEKLVWLQNAAFLQDNVLGRSETVKNALSRLAELIKQGLMPGTVLLITAPAADKRFSFYKTCQGSAEVIEYSPPTKGKAVMQDAVERLRTLLDESGLSMNDRVRQAFLERVGLQSRQMSNEIEKLRTYLGDRKEVERADLDEITSAHREAIAWDLADAFGKRQLARALKIVRQLLFQRESAFALISMLESRIRELMVYRESLDSGQLRIVQQGKVNWGTMSESTGVDLAAALGRDPRDAHPYRAWVLADQAKGFTLAQLQDCKQSALATHRELVTRSLPESLQMEMLLLRMLN
jgi:DNA polymerase-3 subunit delta